MLGVCLGMQFMHVFGSSTSDDRGVKVMDKVKHGRVEEGWTRYHSYGVVGKVRGTVKHTWKEDGVVNIVEFHEEGEDVWGWGIQGHPESVGSKGGKEYLRRFEEWVERSMKEKRGRKKIEVGEEVKDITTKDMEVKKSQDVSHVQETPTRPIVSIPLPTWATVEVFQSYLFNLNVGNQGFKTPTFHLDSGGLSDVGPSRPDGEGGYHDRYHYMGYGRRFHGGLSDAVDSGTKGLWDGEGRGEFKGGVVGYLSYEYGRGCFDGDGGDEGDGGKWMEVEEWVVFDKLEGKGWACGGREGVERLVRELKEWDMGRAGQREVGGGRRKFLDDEVVCRETDFDHGDDGNWRLSKSREEYIADIVEAKKLITTGNTYEICLTNEVSRDLPDEVRASDIYQALRRINPAPYGAYMDFGDLQVCCSSPERFLRIKEGGKMESKPIKGTRKRSADPQLDDAARRELENSGKDRAENLMIVDLVRADFGRTCRRGSVEVPRFIEVESYATVHQLVSTIRGEIEEGGSTSDAVRACFPGGSMTGAPKKRTMGYIREFEGRDRGVYSGSIGWASRGEVDLNICIRTAVVEGGKVKIGCGGAITVRSEEEEEWQEAMVKGNVVRKAVEVAILEKEREREVEEIRGRERMRMDEVKVER
ncbi:hypothetical protein TrCOL_g9546 [Triparma columacea]|uniref:Aminodeoxychorismate synthase n=1 Tax=Triparma columacea TaxID=722753 RepID=A0A9W7L7V2_9STRA|nr:hypothetical protein TrCOL_g9546 [Triparma columacea]